MMRVRQLVVLALSLCSLAACDVLFVSGAAMTAHHYLNEEDPNFAAQNYAVADFLIQQADTYIKHDSLIVAEPLVDIETPEITTTIARLIPEQVGVRLSQLGYLVDLSKVTTSPDTNYLRPARDATREPEFLITGHYLRKSERDVAVFDYPVHMSRRLQNLSTPKPVIIRTTDQVGAESSMH
mgnify:CR=1 FL=1